MRDDFLSADWARHHGQFSRDLRKGLEAVSVALIRLHAIQFDAPWKHETARR